MEDLKQDRLVRLPAVIDRTAPAKTTIYGLMKGGLFPACLRVGVRAVAWRQSQIDAWVETKRPGSSSEEANA